MTYFIKSTLLLGFVLILTAGAKPVAANGDPGPPREHYDANRFDERGYVNTYESLLEAYYGESDETESETHLAFHHEPHQFDESATAVEAEVQVGAEEQVGAEIEPVGLVVEVVESIPVVAEETPVTEVDVAEVDVAEVEAELEAAIEVIVSQEMAEEAQPPVGIEAAAQALVPKEIIESIHSGAYSAGAFRNGHTTILPASGKAMYYNPGVMQIVIAHRMEMGEIQLCGQCIGFAAMLLPGDLNRIVWIILDDLRIEGPFLVVDMAAPHHVDGLIQRQWLIDVDYETAMRWGMNGPVWVTVVDQPLE